MTCGGGKGAKGGGRCFVQKRAHGARLTQQILHCSRRMMHIQSRMEQKATNIPCKKRTVVGILYVVTMTEKGKVDP